MKVFWNICIWKFWKCIHNFIYFKGSFMSTVSTSYGPVIVQSDREVSSSGIVLGICLSMLSAILFTANHFLFQYWHMLETDVLLTRGFLQSVTLGGFIFAFKCCKTFLPTTCSEIFLVLLQGMVQIADECIRMFFLIWIHLLQAY